MHELEVDLPVDLPAKMDAVRSLGRSAPASRDTLELLEEAHALLSVAVRRVKDERDRAARELHRRL